jgi:hypothetical protein
MLQAVMGLEASDQLHQKVGELNRLLQLFDEVANELIDSARTEADEANARRNETVLPEVIPAEKITAEIAWRQAESERLLAEQEKAEDTVLSLNQSLKAFETLKKFSEVTQVQEEQAALLGRQMEQHRRTAEQFAAQIEEQRQAVVAFQDYLRAVALVRDGLPDGIFRAPPS